MKRYKAPNAYSTKDKDVERRTYILPRPIVERIHAFGHKHDCRSETEAAQRLIEIALKAEDL